MTNFIPRTRAVAALLLGAFVAAGAQAESTDPGISKLDARVNTANEVLQEFNRIPEQAIPTELLNKAYAVAVVPNVIRAGFIFGGSYGKGVLVVREADGGWSNPVFITLGNANVGWQIGAQGADLILVFKSPQGVDNIARGKFTIGGTAAASAGPVGRTAVAATDGEFKSEIYTYSRSRGLFAGVAIDGGIISIDAESNAAFYDGTNSGVASRILSDTSIPTPPAARPFLETLASIAPKLTWNPDPASQAAAAARAPAPAQSSGAKTYAVEDAAKPAPETVF